MKLSKPYKKQLIILDLLECGLMIVPKSFPKKSHDCIKRIMKRNENIINMVVPNQRDNLDDKVKKQYQRNMNKIKKIVSESIPGENVNMVMLYNSILCLIEDIKAQIPHTKQELKHEWYMLCQSFNTLYRHIDSNLNMAHDMDEGLKLSNKINEVIN